MIRLFGQFVTLLLSGLWTVGLWAAEPDTNTAPRELGAGQSLQVFAALVMVIAFIIVVAWFTRRFGGLHVGGNGAIRILAGVAVGQRERVVLLQVGEKQLLIGVAPGRVETLHELEQPIDVTSASSGKNSAFAEKLSAALKYRGGEK